MLTIIIVSIVAIIVLLILSILLHVVFDIVSSLGMISYIVFTGLLRFLLITVIVIGTIVIAKKYYRKHFKKS